MFKAVSCFTLTASVLAVSHAYAQTPSAEDNTPALEVVVITPTRSASPLHQVVNDVTVIDETALRQAAGQTLPEILARQTGVVLTSNGGAGQPTSLFLRGTNTNQTVVLVDGVRVASAVTGGSPLHLLPPEQIERIEIVRGPVSGIYGADAIGGVIQIFTKQYGKGLSASAGFGSDGQQVYRLSAVGTIGERTRYALTLAQRETEGFSATTRSNSYSHHPDKDGSRSQSLSLALQHQFDGGHEIGLRALQIHSNTQYDAATGNQFDDRNHTRQSTLSTWFTSRLSDEWQATLTYADSRDWYDSRSRSPDWVRGGFALSNNQFGSHDQRWTWLHQLTLGQAQLNAGVEYLTQEVEGSSRFTEEQRHVKSAFASYLANYDALTVQASLRHDDNSQFGGKTTGSFGLGYRLHPEWRVLAQYGTAYRAPTFADLYQDLPSASYRGNPNLRPEQAYNRELALEHRNAYGQTRLTGFDKKIKDLISYVSDPVTYQGTMANVRQARIKGVSLDSQWQFDQWQLKGNLNWLQAKDADSDRFLPYRPQRFAVLSVAHQFGDLSVGAEWRAVGHRYSAANNAARSRLGGYALGSVFAEYRINRQWSVNGRVDNVFDREYTDYVGYQTAGRSVFAAVQYQP